MTTNTKIYIGLSVTALLAVALIGGAAWSNRRIGELEKNVEAAKRDALGIQQVAFQKEIEAVEYKQKIDYLERHLTEIQTIARKQDEELENLNVNSGRARGDVERVRRTRSITANAGELCKKLAELGHSCR